MSNFPQGETNVATLANTMLDGFSDHAADFPSVDPLALSDAITQYNIAKSAQNQAAAEAKVATENKNVKFDAMMDLMKDDLKTAEVDTNDDPEKLAYIGWGTRDPQTPLVIEMPFAATNLVAIFNGSSQLTLKWKKPVIEKTRPVYSYIIQRRDQLTEDGEFGDWFMVDMAYTNETTLIGQPSNKDMEYRIIASNPAGQSPESNSVAVVLK